MVAGGTGLVGTMVVDALRAAGDTPVLLTRSTGVDLTAGADADLDRALEGASAVIDVSNRSTTARRRAVAFFATTTANLLEAERRAGVGHHVALSVVGCDRVPFGYYLGKHRQEELLAGARGRSTVLRATQFHEFAAQVLDRGGPIVVAPSMLCQPVAAREVATRLVTLAKADPLGTALELAGPEVLRMPDMVRRLARVRHARRPVVTVRLPGDTGRAMATGGLLPTRDGERGRHTFADWLAGQCAGRVWAR